jgi:flagellar protein FliO/FliZ
MKPFVFQRGEPVLFRPCARKLGMVATALLPIALPHGALAQSAAAAAEPAASVGFDGFGRFGGELLLLALIAACAWTVLFVWKRKRQLAAGNNGDERVRVLGITSLGMRERLAVLRVRDRTLLVGVTAAQITLLADLDQPTPWRSAPPPAGTAPANTTG